MAGARYEFVKLRSSAKVNRPVICTLVLLLLFGAGACSPSPAAPETPDEVAELPPYDAEAAEVFDDSIAPEIFGFRVDRSNLMSDKALAQRVREAERIQEVRLTTIQQDKMGSVLRYVLLVSPVAAPLAGESIPADYEVRVGAGSPSLSLIRSMDVELVGKRFILFLKSFRKANQLVVHFRGEPNSDAFRTAITQMRAQAAKD